MREVADSQVLANAEATAVHSSNAVSVQPAANAVPLEIDAAPVSPDRAVRIRRFDGLGWALCGFLIGAVFWHAVGFWSFLTTVVLNGPEEIQIVEPQSMPLLANCTVLVLDRRHGGTRAEPCRSEPLRLEARSTGRADRAVIALQTSVPRYQQWSTTLAPDHDAVASSQ